MTRTTVNGTVALLTLFAATLAPAFAEARVRPHHGAYRSELVNRPVKPEPKADWATRFLQHNMRESG